MSVLLSLVQRLLLCLPPETAHHVALVGLRGLQWWEHRVRGRRVPRDGAPAVHFSVAPRLRFPCRVGLAAGFDKQAEVYPALFHLGFGFIEVGTVTPEPQPGNPKPRIFRVAPRALVNHLGFNSCGVEAFRRHLLRYRGVTEGIPLLANLGKNKETPNEEAIADYRRLAVSLGDLVDGFVINLSSPNTPGLRSLQSAEFLERLTGALPKEIPTWVKLAPDLTDAELVELCDQISRSPRFAGVVLTNTSRQLAESLAGRSQGGLSGEPLFERALHSVALARDRLRAPKLVVGVGGITSAERAVAMRRAGADLIELYTGFVYQGPRLVRACRRALEDGEAT